MIRGARYLYAALAWALVAAILLQVYFIGLGLFAGENLALHRDFGWILHLAPLPILVAAPLARAGRRRIVAAVALTVTIWLVPILAAVRTELPVAAAFHPLGAVVAVTLAIVVARGATRLAVNTTDTTTPTPIRYWVVVALVVVIVLFLSFSGSPE